MDILKHCTEDTSLSFKLNELKAFLRHHSWPLPSAFFPAEVDNTLRKVALSKDEFDQAFYHAGVILPHLEEKLAELKKIQPESMAALSEKEMKIKQLERQISDPLSSQHKTSSSEHNNEKETPIKRKKRLQSWYKEECKLRGERGAYNRTAKREGIARQTISKLL